MTLTAIRDALHAHGLMPRGAFHPDDDALRDARPIVLIGNAGPDMWRAFSAARQPGPDPLDAWTRAVLNPLAVRFRGAMIYPFDGPPYAPFVAWARQAEAVYVSPVGMAVHPVHGLWHAWRGALALPDRIALPPRSNAPSPCTTCAGQPCLSACPVDALVDGGYDVPACTAYLRTPEGTDCKSRGCLARRACPVGRADRYGPAQAAWHMAAFLKGQPQP